jgi:hypothetical protein
LAVRARGAFKCMSTRQQWTGQPGKFGTTLYARPAWVDGPHQQMRKSLKHLPLHWRVVRQTNRPINKSKKFGKKRLATAGGPMRKLSSKGKG